jgi:hypothetical protein
MTMGKNIRQRPEIAVLVAERDCGLQTYKACLMSDLQKATLPDAQHRHQHPLWIWAVRLGLHWDGPVADLAFDPIITPPDSPPHGNLFDQCVETGKSSKNHPIRRFKVKIGTHRSRGFSHPTRNDHLRKLTGNSLSPKSGRYDGKGVSDLVWCFSYGVCRLLFFDASIRSCHGRAGVSLSIHGCLGSKRTCLSPISCLVDP